MSKKRKKINESLGGVVSRPVSISIWDLKPKNPPNSKVWLRICMVNKNQKLM